MLTRQRGIAITLILIAISGVLIVGALGTLAYKLRQSGYESAEAKWKPQAEKATERAQELDAELTKTLEAHRVAMLKVEEYRLVVKQVQDEWGVVKKQQAAQELATKAALAAYAQREQRQSSEIRRLRDIATAPGVVITDRGVDEADTILRSTIRDILGLR